MLSSFGFADGMPSASLTASGLPERDPDWLAANGCAGATRTDLWLDDASPPAARTSGLEGDEARAPRSRQLTDDGARRAVRCIRLRLYSSEEAAWALQSGHLDAPWGGWRETVEGGSEVELSLLSSVLQKDHTIAANTAQMCSAAQSAEQLALQDQRAAAASADLREAIAEETAALAACAERFGVVEQLVAARGQALFG